MDFEFCRKEWTFPAAQCFLWPLLFEKSPLLILERCNHFLSPLSPPRTQPLPTQDTTAPQDAPIHFIYMSLGEMPSFPGSPRPWGHSSTPCVCTCRAPAPGTGSQINGCGATTPPRGLQGSYGTCSSEGSLFSRFKDHICIHQEKQISQAAPEPKLHIHTISQSHWIYNFGFSKAVPSSPAEMEATGPENVHFPGRATEIQAQKSLPFGSSTHYLKEQQHNQRPWLPKEWILGLAQSSTIPAFKWDGKSQVFFNYTGVGHHHPAPSVQSHPAPLPSLRGMGIWSACHQTSCPTAWQLNPSVGVSAQNIHHI